MFAKGEIYLCLRSCRHMPLFMEGRPPAMTRSQRHTLFSNCNNFTVFINLIRSSNLAANKKKSTRLRAVLCLSGFVYSAKILRTCLELLYMAVQCFTNHVKARNLAQFHSPLLGHTRILLITMIKATKLNGSYNIIQTSVVLQKQKKVQKILK